MISKNELQQRIDEVNEIINKTIISDNIEVFPITDGIIDIDRYLKAQYKILWILKEPYDDFNEKGEPIGGGWGLDQAINPKQTIYEFGREKQTFKPMIYASWGILNNFCLWSDMEDVEDNPTMLNALKSIAYINIKKLPGGTSSQYSKIEVAYIKNKNILLKQIEYYNPDIIIGGSTLYNFFQDLGFSKSEMTEYGSLNYIVRKGKIFIDAYHPAQRVGRTGVSKEQYCNDIIMVVKKQFQNEK